MLGSFRNGIDYYKRHRRFLAATALAYYGLVFGVGAVAAITPGGREMQETLLGEATGGLNAAFPGLLAAYMSNPVLAVAYTFAINLVLGTMISITLPGLVLSFLAPLVAFYRAFAWGIIFAPTQPVILLVGLPTILAEGFGYILAVVPSFRLGLSWMLPRMTFKGEELTRAHAFRRAIRELGSAYLIVAATLLAAAIVEVASTQALRLLG